MSFDCDACDSVKLHGRCCCLSSSETALAAAQAENRALRETLQFAYNKHQSHRMGEHDTRCFRSLYEDVRAALATPSDESALREFGLKVARLVASACPMTNAREVHGNAEACVDAVLRGER